MVLFESPVRQVLSSSVIVAFSCSGSSSGGGGMRIGFNANDNGDSNNTL
jgi:hypothetical protein